MKQFFSLFVFFFCGSVLPAQFDAAPTADDFLVNDTEGSYYQLFDLLDAGKSVVVHFTRTDCATCWDYHQSDALQDFYGQHSDEATVLWVESNPASNEGCIYNYSYCDDESEGDWSDGVTYPLVNDNFLAAQFGITEYPTTLLICPTRRILNTVTASAVELENLLNTCSTGTDNIGLLEYVAPSGLLCDTEVISPAVRFQNRGSAELTSAIFQLYLDGVVQETVNWTGSLATFATDTLFFGTYTPDQQVSVGILTGQPNGSSDDDNTDNSGGVPVLLPTVTNENLFTLEILTDNYPEETFWAILDEDQNIIQVGGNTTANNVPVPPSNYAAATLYEHQIGLPADDCYILAFLDSYGDGICCDEGMGYYQLRDAAGTVLATGGEFTDEDISFFQIANGNGISDDARILLYDGEEGFFCDELTLTPVLLVQNFGTNDMTSATVTVTNTAGTLLDTYVWTGNVASQGYAGISTNQITISESDLPIRLELTEVNGNPDAIDFLNVVVPDLGGSIPLTEPQLQLDLQMDQYAYEVFWYISNEAGEVVASGGNEDVNIGGGGVRVAQSTDPGAYQEAFASESITLPVSSNDCYTLNLVDDWGDGFGFQTDAAFLTLLDANGDTLIGQNMSGVEFAYREAGILKTDFVISSVQTPGNIQDLTVHPNPTNGRATVEFELHKSGRMDIALLNAVGQIVWTAPQQAFTMGRHRLSLDLTQFTPGIYLLKYADESGTIRTQKIIKR